jgi:exodeoxyribonuclease III
MLRIISLNLNGIRSAARRGLLPWLARQKADVVCFQEIKAHLGDLSPELASPRGFHAYFHCADKKGYAGVALLTRSEPDRVVTGLGIPEIDREGRFLRADFRKLSVVSIYVPSGTSSAERLKIKFRFMELFLPELQAMRKAGREYIFCGDWNIAHKEIDLKNWRSNRKNSGFLPEERAWLSGVFDDVGLVDVFRRLDQRPEQYTWWSNRGNARANNVGWRIDYQIATPGIAAKAVKASIYTRKFFSDHAPLTIDYEYAP